MYYWGNEVREQDRLWLVSTNAKTVVIILEQFDDYSGLQDQAIWCVGPIRKFGFNGVEEVCWSIIGEYNGHVQISLETYQKFGQKRPRWIWNVDSCLEPMISVLRSRWIPNRDIPEHENRFFASLGFDMFYASKHFGITKNGRLPRLSE